MQKSKKRSFSNRVSHSYVFEDAVMYADTQNLEIVVVAQFSIVMDVKSR